MGLVITVIMQMKMFKFYAHRDLYIKQTKSQGFMAHLRYLRFAKTTIIEEVKILEEGKMRTDSH